MMERAADEECSYSTASFLLLSEMLKERNILTSKIKNTFDEFFMLSDEELCNNLLVIPYCQFE